MSGRAYRSGSVSSKGSASVPLSLQGRGRGPLGRAEWEGEGLYCVGRALTLVRFANLSLSPTGRGVDVASLAMTALRG
jgi:hypothetical protein